MTQDEIIKKIDEAINELVYEKTSLMKAYNYYNGKRDPDQFRHLEMNYGIGTPTQIEFIPLVRKHIDSLVGLYISIPTKPRVSCKDEKTISNIMRDEHLKIKSEVFNFYKTKLNNKIIELFSTNLEELQQDQQSTDPLIDLLLKQLVTDLQNSYVSDYEIAALNILNYIMQSSDIDFETKKEQLTRDLYITGTAYYKINKTKNNESFTIEVLNPLHTFIDRNPNSVYLKDSYRSVIRRYMHKNEILSKYGHLMSNEAISKIKECNTGKETVGNTYYMRAQDLDGNPTTNGIVAGLEVFPGLPSAKSEMSYNNRLLEVLEVEWLEVEKENGEFITYRYEGIRINGCIYIPIGKDNDSIRSVNDSSKTNISVNGLFFSDRNSQPFSLVLATANLQD